MPYRRDQHGDIIGPLHHALTHLLHIQETPDEKEYHHYRGLSKRLLSDFPSDGALLNPESFKSGLVEAINLLRQLHQTPATSFISKNVPYEELSLSPNQLYSRVSIVRPTLELLQKHPDRNFPDDVREGINLTGNDLHLIVLDSKTQRRVIVRPEEGIIKPTDSDGIKLVAALAAWCIDPDRIRQHP